MKDILTESYNEYLVIMSNNIKNYWNVLGHLGRRKQCESLINTMLPSNKSFNFEKIITLETGASQNFNDGNFGLFLGLFTEKMKGKMISVDINDETIRKSEKLFNEYIPNLVYETYVGDSVEVLSNLEEIPNFVHLDSLDLNLLDPLPSALHGWREFVTIESKMPSGSIIMIDDNYKKDTWVEWKYPDGSMVIVENKYPMTGKGAHIYQYVLSGVSDWELIGTHYGNAANIKIIIQKK